jgi:hypothetical protein
LLALLGTCPKVHVSRIKVKNVTINNDQTGKLTTLAPQPRSWGWYNLGNSLVTEGETVNQ